jgi:hypothetical protein
MRGFLLAALLAPDVRGSALVHSTESRSKSVSPRCKSFNVAGLTAGDQRKIPLHLFSIGFQKPGINPTVKRCNGMGLEKEKLFMLSLFLPYH